MNFSYYVIKTNNISRYSYSNSRNKDTIHSKNNTSLTKANININSASVPMTDRNYYLNN
jgi:hypothetical protein